MQEKYFSEFGQDELLDTTIFNKKKKGTFVEVGAGNGIYISNTNFFEKFREWQGICIEPRVSQFHMLQKNRSCFSENICIVNSDIGYENFTEYKGGWLSPLSGLKRNFYPEHLAKVNEGLSQSQYRHEEHNYRIKAERLQTILEKYNFLTIDYCSIDTEGSELEVLNSIDFTKSFIKVFSVENNFANKSIEEFMLAKDYKLTGTIGVPGFAIDEIYVHKNFL